ncbi:MAG: hypothetical protein Ct9H90mP20_6560 [Candidatus Neomarinimicrobiota bacterium]|nr:MAG: hypothetical protein Ct9H90mP20_6560 [Candidatus Neomarinimicrobiota bacterium]
MGRDTSNCHTQRKELNQKGVNTEIFNTGKGKIELLNSISEDSPIRKFLEKRGPGIHHICLEVDNINQAKKGNLKIQN